MSGDAPGESLSVRRTVSALLVAVLALAAVFAGTTPASAAPPSSGRVDVDKWPAALRWAIPGTDQFKSKYMTKTADQPCSEEDGGNPYDYVTDYLNHTGEVFQMISHTSGTPVLAITDIGGARTDMPELFNLEIPLKDDMAMPPFLIAPGTAPQAADGKGWCGRDFAQFGVTDPTAPFGFTYYSAPDAGSTKFIDTSVSQLASANPGYKKYWTNRYEHGFDARNLDSYCSQDSPFCLTASFLHCDQRNGDKPDPSLLSWCQTWNYQVAMYNVRIMEFVRLYGTNSFDESGHLIGPMKPLDIASTAMRDTPDPLGEPTTDMAAIGHDGYLARWAAAMAIPDYIDYLRGFGKALSIGTAVALGAAAGIAAFWLGAGLLTALLIGGAVAAFTVFEGACDDGWSKCLAQAAAEGMAYQLGAVPEAATSVQLPNMKTSLWKSTFNDVATISLSLLVLLFVMNLIMSLVTGKPVLILRSLLGVLGWTLVLTAGGTILGLVVQARDSATRTLSGGPGYMAKLTNKMVDAINQLGTDQSFAGWLWVALLCVVALLCGLIVYAVLYISSAWVPLVIAILILQLAGWAAPGLSASKWFRRGLSVLWSILITPPLMVLLWRVGTTMLGASSAMNTLIVGAVTLLASALAFRAVTGLFSLGVSGRLGIGSATIGSIVGAVAGARAVGGLLGGGASSRPGKSAGEMTNDQLSGASGGARSGALSSIVSKISPVPAPAGAGAGVQSASTRSAGGQQSDPWATSPSSERAASTSRAGTAIKDRPTAIGTAGTRGDITGTTGERESTPQDDVSAAVIGADQVGNDGRHVDTTSRGASLSAEPQAEATPAATPRHLAGSDVAGSDAVASPNAEDSVVRGREPVVPVASNGPVDATAGESANRPPIVSGTSPERHRAAADRPPGSDATASPAAAETRDSSLRRGTSVANDPAIPGSPGRSVGSPGTGGAPPPAPSPAAAPGADLSRGARVPPATAPPRVSPSAPDGPAGPSATPPHDEPPRSSLSTGGPSAITGGSSAPASGSTGDAPRPWDVPASEAVSPPSGDERRPAGGPSAELPPWHNVDRPWTHEDDVPDSEGEDR